MKTQQQIEHELERVKVIEKQYEDATDDDGKRYWLDAFHLRQVLEWVLGR